MLDWFAETWHDFKQFLYSLVLTVFDMLKDLFLWIFEGLLDISILALQGLDTYFDGLNIASYINQIPESVQWFLSAIGVPQAMTMIITAITIRLLLQLIPFTRLGS